MPICHNCNGTGKHLGLGGVYEKCRPCNETGRVAEDNSGLPPTASNPTIVETAPIVPTPIPSLVSPSPQTAGAAQDIQALTSSIAEIHLDITEIYSHVDKILRLLLTKAADDINDEAHEKSKSKKKSKSV